MAVTLTQRIRETGYCEFAYDSWNNDGDLLPRIGISGKGALATIGDCCQGSMAIGTDGGIKILKGDTNEWIDY